MLASSFVRADVEIFLGDEKILVNSRNGEIISSEPVEIASSKIPPTLSNLKTPKVKEGAPLPESTLSFRSYSRAYPVRPANRRTKKSTKNKDIFETFKLIKKREDAFGKELLSALRQPTVIINLNRLKNKDNLRFERALRKLGSERILIERLFSKNKLPIELLAIAFVESNFDQEAVSTQGALGMWQFIRSTGKFYALENEADFFDAKKSSLAAVTYLKDLHKNLKSWTLAIAAYNAGEGRVRQAIKLAGGSTNFWEISSLLPRETQKYVPHVLAAAAIMYEYEHQAEN